MNILLGVSGGIAAYKSAVLTRLLVSAGHSVRVVMTPAARDFITPLTMATLSGNPVAIENFSPENGAWNSHIKLGEWADLILIAPATANTLAKMAGGIADNLLLCSYLSARCPVVVAPAMDLDMWAHPTTQENIAKLKGVGVEVVEPGEGFLASGLVGKGRMAEPETIAGQVDLFFCARSDFQGKRVVITAGATVERIDPMRCITNFSTGKMGRALADEFSRRGAEVTLIMGQLSASEMYDQAKEAFATCDIAVFAAAVADYTVANPATEKIKHSDQELTLRLVPTKDIAAELSATKRADQFCMGFALESAGGDQGEQYALGKLRKKNLDAIVLNSLADPGAGFGVDTNKVTIYDKEGSTIPFGLKSKREVACDVVDWIKTRLR